MGASLTYLSREPVTTVKTEVPSDYVVASSMQGWRRAMEDAHFVFSDDQVHMFGVFDGHGGSGVARYCAKRLPHLIRANPHYQAGDYPLALHESFMAIDEECMDQAVQEEILGLHMAAKSEQQEDLRKVEILFGVETLLELFLGRPQQWADFPPDPFRVFLDSYELPDVQDLLWSDIPVDGGVSNTPPSKRMRRSGRRGSPTSHMLTTETHSPWGHLAARLRECQGSEERLGEILNELRTALSHIQPDNMLASTPLMELRRDVDWAAEGRTCDGRDQANSELLSDPIKFLFTGPLVDLFHAPTWVPSSLPPYLRQWVVALHPTDLLAALNNNYRTADNRLCVAEDQGCTANVVLVDFSRKKLFCANAGDSRAVLISENGASPEEGSPALHAQPLSIDHKPGLPEERRRVLFAGGKVLGKADPRVQGDLNLSRAFGDWRHKTNAQLPLELQMISPRPDIAITDLEQKDKYLVLACDGIWERFNASGCAKFFQEKKSNGEEFFKSIGGDMCHHVLRKVGEFPGAPVGVTVGCDNMSVVVVDLLKLREQVTVVDEKAAADEKAITDDNTPVNSSRISVVSFGAQVPSDWRPARKLGRFRRLGGNAANTASAQRD